MDHEIDTAAKRARLAPRRNPYWFGISGGRGGLSLGYRRVVRGPGTWIAKIVIDGARIEGRIALADDIKDKPGALSYAQGTARALEWGRQQFATIESHAANGEAAVPTVGSAVERYIDARKQRSAAGLNAGSRLRRHVLADATFSAIRLARLRSEDFDRWRARLQPAGKKPTAGRGKKAKAETKARALKPATINRLLNDLRAALNAAAEKHRRELSSNVAAEIKIGTRALAAADEARRQLLTDKQIRKIVESAYVVDEDFGAVVMLAAATGARFSQLMRVTVGNVQHNRQRVLIPASHKGRGQKAYPLIAVPIGLDVLARLERLTLGRNADEPLLLRWIYRQVSPLQWDRHERRPWCCVQETARPWSKTVELSQAPEGTVMYALRHSSIVRGLNAGLPIRLVAALHDTSVQMIEKHYAAFIVDASEEIARRAIMSFAT